MLFTLTGSDISHIVSVYMAVQNLNFDHWQMVSPPGSGVSVFDPGHVYLKSGPVQLSALFFTPIPFFRALFSDPLSFLSNTLFPLVDPMCVCPNTFSL